MSYNYASAFVPQRPPIKFLTKQQLSELTLAAFITYSMTFPDANETKVSVYYETKHIELHAVGCEPRIYSWKELGFQF